jgi:hypothetical protein
MLSSPFNPMRSVLLKDLLAFKNKGSFTSQNSKSLTVQVVTIVVMVVMQTKLLNMLPQMELNPIKHTRILAFKRFANITIITRYLRMLVMSMRIVIKIFKRL